MLKNISKTEIISYNSIVNQYNAFLNEYLETNGMELNIRMHGNLYIAISDWGDWSVYEVDDDKTFEELFGRRNKKYSAIDISSIVFNEVQYKFDTYEEE